MLARRLRQFGQMLGPGALPGLRVTPFPWREPQVLRYPLSHALDDPDGHGGYTRLYRFDDRGVPYGEAAGGPLYDPLVVARYGIRMHAVSGEHGDAEAARRAQCALEPLLASAASTGAWGRASRADAMSTDRPSALVQGVALSALVRLTHGAPGPRVRDVIERAFARLAAPVEQGGTVSRLDGGAFLEEYPSSPPSHVLNGAIYALCGLYDLEDALGHAAAGALARDVEHTLERALPRFEAALGWSRYALCLRRHALLSSAHYHRLHVSGLRLLAGRTGREAFARTADRWERTLRSPWRRTPMALLKACEVMFEGRVMDAHAGGA